MLSFLGVRRPGGPGKSGRLQIRARKAGTSRPGLDVGYGQSPLGGSLEAIAYSTPSPLKCFLILETSFTKINCSPIEEQD